VSYATRLDEFRGEYEGRFRFESSKLEAGIKARASGFEVVRFYGFGNETQAIFLDKAYRVHQDQFSIEPRLSFPLGTRAIGHLGGVVKRVRTEDAASIPLSTLRPYGIEATTQLGAIAGFDVDTTDRTGLPTRGVRVNGGGSAYPAVAGLDKAFGELHGEASAYVTAGATLALRAGAKQLFGTYPFYEAAYLGGAPSLRGLRLQRYAGDAMVHGGADLYIPVTKAFLLVPGEIGVFGLADFGRVYLDGERSDRWHRGFGGGVYFVSPNRNNSLELSVAKSEGRTGVYLKLGLAL
jgi:outer membrane protein assembly factor BamA